MRRIAGDSIRVVICDFAIFRHENPELPQPYEHSNQSSPRHTEYTPLIERKDQPEASDKYDSQRNQYRHELEMFLAIVKSEPTDLGHRHGSHIYPGYPFIKPTVHHRSDNAIKHSEKNYSDAGPWLNLQTHHVPYPQRHTKSEDNTHIRESVIVSGEFAEGGPASIARSAGRCVAESCSTLAVFQFFHIIFPLMFLFSP